MPAFSSIENGLKKFGSIFTSGKQKNISKSIPDMDGEINPAHYESVADNVISKQKSTVSSTTSSNAKTQVNDDADYLSNYYRDTAESTQQDVNYNSAWEYLDEYENIANQSGKEFYVSGPTRQETATSFTSGRQTEDIPIYDGGKTFTNANGETVNIGGAKRYAFRRQQNRVNSLEEQINNAGENTNTSALEQSLEQERQKLEAMQQDPTQIRTRPADYFMGNPKLITGAVGATVTGGLVLELARSNGSLSNEQLYGQAPLQNDYY